jgi:hypothetical protein
LERLAAFYDEALTNTEFPVLWRLTQPPRIGAMRPKSIDLQPYDRKTAWKDALGAVEGQRRAGEAADQFERVSAAIALTARSRKRWHELAALCLRRCL